MAVAIRLKRFGKKKKPVYRIVIADQRRPRDGKTIEEVGFYDPQQDPVQLNVNEERVKYWISVGAQPTQTVDRLLGSLSITKPRKPESKDQKVAKKDRKKSTDEDS